MDAVVNTGLCTTWQICLLEHDGAVIWCSKESFVTIKVTMSHWMFRTGQKPLLMASACSQIASDKFILSLHFCAAHPPLGWNFLGLYMKQRQPCFYSCKLNWRDLSILETVFLLCLRDAKTLVFLFFSWAVEHVGVIRKEKAYNWCFCHSSLKVENNHYFKSRKQSGLVQNSAAPSPLRSADSVETFTMVRAYRLLEQKENVRGHLNTSAKAFMPNWTLQSYPLSTYADAASNLRCWPLLQTSDNGFSAQCTTDCFCFSKEPTTTVCGTFLALWPALLNKSRLYISSWKHTTFWLLVSMNNNTGSILCGATFPEALRSALGMVDTR